MSDTFITKIQINEVRNICNLSVPLSDKERKHLIITGKNGSGKTSLLNELYKFLMRVESPDYQHYFPKLNSLKIIQTHLAQLSSQVQTEQIEEQKKQAENQINTIRNWFNSFGETEISFTNSDSMWKDAVAGNFLILFFEAQRHTVFRIPTGITKINLKKKYSVNERASQDFMQYIANLKADRSFAKDDGEKEAVQQIDEWFARFEKSLQNLFQSPQLQLKFDRKNYTFEIIKEGQLPFGFDTLSDGYSAIISITTELLLRMEGHDSKAYDLEGVVLIDEIETHLHVDLQKKVLPFLIDFFPKIQFIVSTHSPFVLSSVSNAIICDLETPLVTGDLSGYSYDALIESFFNTDKYSEALKQKIIDYEKISSQSQISDQEREDLRQLRNYFSHVPKYLSRELLVKLQQIELQNLAKKSKR